MFFTGNVPFEIALSDRTAGWRRCCFYYPIGQKSCQKIEKNRINIAKFAALACARFSSGLCTTCYKQCRKDCSTCGKFSRRFSSQYQIVLEMKRESELAHKVFLFNGICVPNIRSAAESAASGSECSLPPACLPPRPCSRLAAGCAISRSVFLLSLPD